MIRLRPHSEDAMGLGQHPRVCGPQGSASPRSPGQSP